MAVTSYLLSQRATALVCATGELSSSTMGIDPTDGCRRPKEGRPVNFRAAPPCHAPNGTKARAALTVNDCNRPGPWDSLDRRSGCLGARGAFAPATALRRCDHAGIHVRKPAGIIAILIAVEQASQLLL